MEETFLNNTLEQWVYALVWIAGTIIAAKILDWIFKAIKKRQAKKENFSGVYLFVDLLEKPVIFALVIFWCLNSF